MSTSKSSKSDYESLVSYQILVHLKRQWVTASFKGTDPEMCDFQKRKYRRMLYTFFPSILM